MKRGLELLVQLLLIFLAVVLASKLSLAVVIVPRMLNTKPAYFSTRQLGEVIAVMLAAHAIAFGLSRITHRRTLATATPRRFLVEMYFTLAATSLASSGMFLLSSVPFSVNFYAWIYAGIVGLMTAMFLAVLAWRRARGGHEAGWLRSEIRDAWRLVPSVWTAVTLMVVILPGVLAVAYKKSSDFANVVNSMRMAVRDDGDSHWSLVDAWPGQTFEQPMWVEFDPQRAERFYLLSRPGRLHRYDAAPKWESELLIDFADVVGTVDVEMGALSFALHPNFGKQNSPSSGFVYIWHNRFRDKQTWNCLSRFDLALPTPDARLQSRTVLIDQKRPSNGMHNGGSLMFGPDGFLYLTVGDFMMNDAQNLAGRLSGGVLRIDVDQRSDRSTPIRRQPKDAATANYFIPKENPWHGQPDVLEEFWAIGMRNPFRAWIDPTNGDVWLGDVGWERWEELNRMPKGGNGQWPFMEGPEPYRPRPQTVPGKEVPAFYSYRQTSMDRAVVGGLVYRGNRHPSLASMYIYADNNSSSVRAIDPVVRGEPLDLARTNQLGQQGITGIVVSPRGDLLVLTLGSKERPNGRVLKLASAAEAGAAPTTSPTTVSLDQVVTEKYDMVCSRCHGSDGKGNPTMVLGQALTPRPDFTNPAWHPTTTDQQMRTAILKGSQAIGRSNDMPAWEGFISEEEADEMVKKIRAFAPKQ